MEAGADIITFSNSFIIVFFIYFFLLKFSEGKLLGRSANAQADCSFRTRPAAAHGPQQKSLFWLQESRVVDSVMHTPKRSLSYVLAGEECWRKAGTTVP